MRRRAVRDGQVGGPLVGRRAPQDAAVRHACRRRATGDDQRGRVAGPRCGSEAAASRQPVNRSRRIAPVPRSRSAIVPPGLRPGSKVDGNVWTGVPPAYAWTPWARSAAYASREPAASRSPGVGADVLAHVAGHRRRRRRPVRGPGDQVARRDPARIVAGRQDRQDGRGRGRRRRPGWTGRRRRSRAYRPARARPARTS